MDEQDVQDAILFHGIIRVEQNIGLILVESTKIFGMFIASSSCFALVSGLTDIGRDRPFNILRAPSVSWNSLIPISTLTLS